MKVSKYILRIMCKIKFMS